MKHFCISVMVMMFTSSLFSQTVDEVVDKYVEAMGGKDKMNSIQSIYMDAVSVMQNGNEVTSKMWKVNGKLMRREINFGMGSVTTVLTDKEGWTSNPRNGNKFEPMTPDAVLSQQAELDCAGPLVDYKVKGSTAELLGKEEVEGTECNKIKLTVKGGRDITYYIDTKNNYIIRMKTKGGGMGQRGGGNPDAELVIDYSDYRKTPDGYFFPFATTRLGMGSATNIEKIEVNKPVDPKLYKAE